ncbi:MAG: hypothetical protein AO394_03225 [Candidatus Fermentibacter daniensis]|nr:MAG: hypothetical protein AO394_03225 [Candidatus Fermentibacter daniensis]
MAEALPRQEWMTREPRLLRHLVHRDGIDEVRGYAQRACDSPGQGCAEVAGVVRLEGRAIRYVLEQSVVDQVCAGLQRLESASATDDGRKSREIETPPGERGKHQVAPGPGLVQRGAQRGKLLRQVSDRFLEDRLGLPVDPELRGGSAWIEGENQSFHLMLR